MADDVSDEENERGVLCANYNINTAPACGKSGAKLCSLFYIVLNCLSCSLFVHIVGFSTGYWSHGENFYHNGLWLACGLNTQKRCQYLPYDAGWFQATQALETLGLFAGFFSLVFLVLFIFHAQSSTNKAIFVMGMISTLVAAGLTILGIVIYGAKNRDLSWSYGLTVIAGIMYTVSGILMVIHLNTNLQQTS